MAAAVIRALATDEPDDVLDAYARVVREVTPESPTSAEEMRWQDATYPGGRRFIAEAGDRIVATASVGRMHVHPPEFPRFWFSIEVLASERRQGLGSRLLGAVSEHTARAGKIGLQTSLSEIHADGIAFLEHRGFVEIERSKSVRLALAGLEPPPVRELPGITITTLAERPDVVPGVHEVAVLAFPDIPYFDEPTAPGPYEEFRARDVDRPGIPPDAFFVALDDATHEVAGYASLLYLPGRTDIAWHDMTAVRPSARGRGIARALKEATIRWAIQAGLAALDTGNDVENAPMRAINARLGYRPLPDDVELRGPLVPGPDGDPSSSGEPPGGPVPR